ncbi:MAG: signal peptidase I [Planctomycetota bacterium]
MKDLKTERWIKENVEAIAIAIVMALVIRQFAIEAFKIPTESMNPTLLGDNGGGTGDRILVFKVPYLLGEPDRWDIVVFKYPLNISKNYIKRLVGLPGETLEITRDGDILIDGKIARKPPHIQDVLFREKFPGELSPQGLRHAWKLSGPGVSRPAADTFVVKAADCTYDRGLKSGDVRLTMEVTAAGPGEVFLHLQENGVRFELVLAVGEGESYLLADGKKHPVPDVNLDPGRATDVVMVNVDDAILIEVGGRSFSHEYEPILTRAGQDLVQFGARGGEATFAEVRLSEDIFYNRDGAAPWEIGEDEFFMLGDNTGNSQDSRKWNLNRVKLADGNAWEYEGRSDPEDLSQRPRVGPGEVTKMDRDGIWRVWNEDDVVDTEHFDSPFVPKANLVGKAFFVFWPLNPLTDQFRLKFIR